MDFYTLTNWTRQSDALYGTLDQVRTAMRTDLHQGDRYTIWSMVSEGGQGEAVEEGIYEPPSD